MQAHQDDWAARAFEADEAHRWVTMNAAALAEVQFCMAVEQMIMEPDTLEEEKKVEE